MLDESRDCFLTAELVYLTGQAIDEPQDERWLYQYMLAKIAEKKKEEPPNFLKYYSNASQLLYEIEAQYPKRIIHKNPQNLAVEALEVYYRIHASILKYLEQHEGKSLKKSLAIVLEENLKNCLQSPFASNGLKFDDNSIHNKGSNLNLLKGDKLNAISLSCPSNKKNFSNTRSCTINDLNRLNSNDILHIDLMQDVVTLTDEIITKVCAIVSAEKPDSEKQKKDSKLKLKDAGTTTYEPEEKKKKLHYLSENPINHTDHYKTEGEKWKSFNSYDKKASEGSEKSDKRSHM
ncbi:uncharacterized protein LOC106646550, partial [Copidosoma floridanum]|uniref:uncharacterized protein LOC106646550 n=1 Tax=Copidosoma floridanum TaxID=29053 RepID=UPI0006C9D6EB